ncbi:MAG: M23 family metallopeptidase [Pseudomonadota bacterium]|nr:M23 family metallopeptidase [Pseudomonadota bacterium]
MRLALGQTFKKFGAAICAALISVAAAPAYASSSSSAAAADVTAPIESEAGDDLATGDPRFRELFASWTALDNAGPDPFAIPTMNPSIERPVVSVPSRNPLNSGRISSGYGMRTHPVLGRRARHKGIDLAAPTGTPVYATADGMVKRAHYSRTYGLVIYLDHGSSLETRYAHLSKLNVADGQPVRKGDLIGFVGSTGRSTGPHLHYEVRVDGLAVNPIPYMKEGAARAALSETTGPVNASGRVRPGQLGQGGQ